jgi:glycosyltransferase involved in cell wall biosynthesis
MKILWLTWKDSKHPQSGGAEIVTRELTKRLVADGHEVLLISAGFSGAKSENLINGVKILRLGNRFTVYLEVSKYYKKHLRGWPDLVIDECNTIPFFASLYIREPVIMFFHQLAREVWFYQMPWPISWIGYILEPVYLRMLRGNRVITISESTKKNLLQYGFQSNRSIVISEGIELTPMDNINKAEKYKYPTLLYLGALREMKRPDNIIQAFEFAKKKQENLRLIIAGGGEGKYFQRVMKQIQDSPYAADIEYLGKVNIELKIALLRKVHILLVASIKEGWGLVVTEAASQGTPAISYDVDGLRDSICHKKTGLLTEVNTPEYLARSILTMIQNPKDYSIMRNTAWEWSRLITFDQSYRDFDQAIMKFGIKE